MFGFSLGEILFLAALALIVIGPKELPQVARSIGRLLNELKRTAGGFTEELQRQARVDLNETPKPQPPSPPQAVESQQLELGEHHGETPSDETKKS
ncbi:MAG TPA: twin-arginine translocase TatA/TatE family subunit [Bdellovibrio sp.]|nr:twin-arginine translocase TatA/TatE family subunit [Bdellovibrio sp.]